MRSLAAFSDLTKCGRYHISVLINKPPQKITDMNCNSTAGQKKPSRTQHISYQVVKVPAQTIRDKADMLRLLTIVKTKLQ